LKEQPIWFDSIPHFHNLLHGIRFPARLFLSAMSLEKILVLDDEAIIRNVWARSSVASTAA